MVLSNDHSLSTPGWLYIQASSSKLSGLGAPLTEILAARGPTPGMHVVQGLM